MSSGGLEFLSCGGDGSRIRGGGEQEDDKAEEEYCREDEGCSVRPSQ